MNYRFSLENQVGDKKSLLGCLMLPSLLFMCLGTVFFACRKLNGKHQGVSQ
jgi:hypothetical protein